MNVTQVKRPDETLRDPAEPKRLSHDAVLVWRVEAGIELWSGGAEQLFGYSAGEARGRAPHDLLRTTLPRPWPEIEAALRRDGRWDGDVRHVTKGGSTVTVSAKLELVLDEHGSERVLETNRDDTARRRAEEDLRGARERAEWIARLPEANPHPVFRLDARGNVLYANAAARAGLAALGLESHRAVQGKIAESAQLALAQKRWRASEIVSGDRTYLMTFVPVEADVNVYGTDITLRKRIDEALRRSEHRFRTLTENAPDLVARYDRDLKYVYANPAVTRALGLEIEELVGRASDTGEPPETAAEWERSLREVLESGHPRRTELASSRTGSRRWYDVRIVPEPSPEGTVQSVLAISRDITERKRAEQQLERSREALRRLLETSLRVLSEKGHEKLLQIVSDAALELTRARIAIFGHGYVDGKFGIGGSSRAPGSPECPPGRSFAIDRGGVHMDLVAGRDSILLTDEELRVHPRWRGLPEGHVPVRGLLGVRLEDADGRMSGIILVTDREEGDFTAEDESLLRQLGAIASLALQHVTARVRLEEADRRKDEFLAMLSHELRNPLAPVRHGLYVLERAAPGSEVARRAHAVIDRQVAHMTRLVDDLLDVTRISRGKIQLQVAPVDVCELVRRAVEDHRAVFAGNGVSLWASYPDRLVPVHGDATRLAQVIGNLLQNAAKFTGTGGHTDVRVAYDERAMETSITVRDTGVGISSDMLPRLFEPFAQADSTLDRSRGGLGLGLALVKSVVELHGGRVAARSDGPGMGAEFAVSLPLRPESLPDAGPTECPGAGPGRRVLVVEDNVDAADTLREVLEIGGHQVAIAHDGTSALDQARQLRPEVVLCDIGLPGMDGYEVAKAIRADAELCSAYLVALTGYAAPDDLARARQAGFDEHVAKPAGTDRLERILARAPPLAERRADR